MKNWICYTYALLLFLTFPAYLLAQARGNEFSTQLTDSSSKVAEGIALYTVGKPEEAKVLLTTIPKSDPIYPVAQRYRALCLHDLRDYHGFIKALEKFDARAVVVPPQVLETLAYDQIDGLFYFRKFEDIFPAIRSFQIEYSASARLSAVTEYQLGSLFERGLKKTLEACQLKDEAQFTIRWTEGRSNLEQFLSLARASSLNSYTALTNRSLREDVWTARFVLGDETIVSEEISAHDATSREKFSLLRALLYPKLQRDHADENLKRLTAFLTEFPNSRSRLAVEAEIADVALVKGEQLVVDARLSSDVDVLTEKRSAAAPYLNLAYANLSQIIDREADSQSIEVHEAKEGLLRVYFAQENWKGLSTLVDQMTSDSPSGEKEWRAAKLYAGAGLVLQGNLNEAGQVLDELLASGFRGNPSYDGPLVAAARWRIRVARRSGDEATAQKIIQQVQNSICEDSIKRTFLKKFQTPAAQSNAVSQ